MILLSPFQPKRTKRLPAHLGRKVHHKLTLRPSHGRPKRFGEAEDLGDLSRTSGWPTPRKARPYIPQYIRNRTPHLHAFVNYIVVFRRTCTLSNAVSRREQVFPDKMREYTRFISGIPLPPFSVTLDWFTAVILTSTLVSKPDNFRLVLNSPSERLSNLQISFETNVSIVQHLG